MKTRNGFVSNSSSSSFIVFGKGVGFYNIKEQDIKSIWVRGEHVGEGYDVFQLTEEMYLWMLDNPGLITRFDFVNSIHTMYPEDAVEVTIDIPKGTAIFDWERSQHSVSDFRVFKERYSEN